MKNCWSEMSQNESDVPVCQGQKGSKIVSKKTKHWAGLGWQKCPVTTHEADSSLD